MSNNAPLAPTASSAATQPNLADNTAATDNSSKQSVNTDIASADMPLEPNIDALLDIADDVAITWVREQSQLAEVIDALATCGRVALDTEFIKRDTYYPRLALVQLNTGDHVYLLDAPQLQLADFWQALSEVDIAIWHACGEDLGIFYLLSWLSAVDQYF